MANLAEWAFLEQIRIIVRLKEIMDLNGIVKIIAFFGGLCRFLFAFFAARKIPEHFSL